MKVTDINAALDPQFERVEMSNLNKVSERNRITKQGIDAMITNYLKLERELDNAQAEVVRLKGEAESWEKVFDKTCKHLADAKSELAETVAKERERCALVCERSVTAPSGTYQILMAAAAKIRKGE